MATICVTNSITIQPGENFVLPPGAEIIGSTDVDSITSSCADLTSVEEFECYVFQIMATEYSGVINPVYNPDNVFVHGLYKGDTDTSYNFSSGVLSGIPDIFANIVDRLDTKTTLSNTISNLCVAFDEDTVPILGDHGQVVAVSFKTIPSIAKNLFLKLSTVALIDPDFTSYYYIPAQKYVDTVGTKCDCPL